MKLYLVPDGEVSRFAMTFNKQSISEVNHPIKDALILIEEVSDADLKLINANCITWRQSRTVIASKYVGSPISDPSIELIELFPESYIRYWTNFYRLTTYPSTIKRLVSQVEFSGYDSFISLVQRLHYLSLSEGKKRKLSSVPSVWNLYEAIASGVVSQMLDVFFKARTFYGQSTLVGSISTFLDRVISFLESPTSISSYSEQYQEIIKQTATSLSSYAIVLALKFLSQETLPYDLRIMLCFRMLNYVDMRQRTLINIL